MAAGDIKWFAQALEDLGNKLINMNSDDLYLGIAIDTPAPTVGDATPCWNSTGTVDFYDSKASEGGGYTGPIRLEISGGGAGSQTWALVGTVPTLRADVIVIPQNGSGFTNGRYGIIWDSTHSTKRAIAFVDLGSVRDITLGSLTVDWNGANNDILTITQS